MNRIYIEITRTNNEVDLYRFEDSFMLARAISFLEMQLLRDDIKVWVMKNIPTLAIDRYDVIED